MQEIRAVRSQNVEGSALYDTQLSSTLQLTDFAYVQGPLSKLYIDSNIASDKKKKTGSKVQSSFFTKLALPTVLSRSVEPRPIYEARHYLIADIYKSERE